jgi:hypothetical protein
MGHCKCEKDDMTCPLYHTPLYHIIGVSMFNLLHWGWSEPAATNAPVEDEAVQAVLRMN